MQQIVTITSKFQVHIPKKIREESGILKHGPIVMRADKGKIIIEKKKGKSILDLAGKYKRKAKLVHIDLDNVRDYINYSDL